MASAVTVVETDQEILNLFASDDEEDFEGFNLDEMPLSLIARAHGGERNERLSDNEDMDEFQIENDEDSVDESADETEQTWSHKTIFCLNSVLDL